MIPSVGHGWCDNICSDEIIQRRIHVEHLDDTRVFVLDTRQARYFIHNIVTLCSRTDGQGCWFSHLVNQFSRRVVLLGEQNSHNACDMRCCHGCAWKRMYCSSMIVPDRCDGCAWSINADTRAKIWIGSNRVILINGSNNECIFCRCWGISTCLFSLVSSLFNYYYLVYLSESFLAYKLYYTCYWKMDSKLDGLFNCLIGRKMEIGSKW